MQEDNFYSKQRLINFNINHNYKVNKNFILLNFKIIQDRITYIDFSLINFNTSHFHIQDMIFILINLDKSRDCILCIMDLSINH